MTVYLSNRDGNGKTSEEGHYKFPVNAFTGNVLTSTDLIVSQQDTLVMGVKIAAGQFRIPSSSGTYAYTGWSDASTNVAVSTADSANPRISAIVVYVDKNAATSASPPNNPGIAKFASVDGSPGAVPVIPNATQISAAIGSGNPYVILASVRVPAAAANVVNSYITDMRTFVTVAPNLVNSSSIQDGSVNTAEMADGAVITQKLADQAVTTRKLAANYYVVTGSTGSTTRQTLPNMGGIATVSGQTLVYTSGPTAELLDIRAQALITQNGGGGIYYITVNGNFIGRVHHTDVTQWLTRMAEAFYAIPANTTITIETKYQTGGVANGGTIANSTTDQSSSNSYGPMLRVLVWGKTA